MKRNLPDFLSRRLVHSRYVLTRRWYLAVIALLLTFPGLLYVHNASGVYYSTVNVLFLPPPNAVGGGNTLRAEAGSTVQFAALVERKFNEGRHSDKLPQPTSAPLYATGVKHGIWVYLPNAGGQWQTNFNRAELRVEVVGQSETEVLDNMRMTLDALKLLSLEPQVDMGIFEEARITTEMSPDQPMAAYAWVRNSRAEIAVGMIMVSVAYAAAHLGDLMINLIGRNHAKRKLRRTELQSTSVSVKS